MENPIKMDDLGVPLFSETPIQGESIFLTFKLTIGTNMNMQVLIPGRKASQRMIYR